MTPLNYRRNFAQHWVSKKWISKLLSACSSVDSDWSTAQSENAVAGYQAFLEKHLNGHQADEAWARLGL